MAVRLFPDPTRPDPRWITCAAEALLEGGIVVMPTDTVYGLAALPEYEARLFQAKARPPQKQIARLLASADQAPVPLPETALTLARSFWPGALTLVVPAGEDWIGLRVPAHPVALALLRAVGQPLAVTSANASGAPAALTAADAAAGLRSTPDEILDAGPMSLGYESTVVRVRDNTIELLRPGAIPFDVIEARSNAFNPGPADSSPH